MLLPVAEQEVICKEQSLHNKYSAMCTTCCKQKRKWIADDIILGQANEFPVSFPDVFTNAGTKRCTVIDVLGSIFLDYITATELKSMKQFVFNVSPNGLNVFL